MIFTIYLGCSAKMYNLSRNFLPFPSYQKLYIKFGDDIKSEKKNLIEISMVDEVIQTYKHENHNRNLSNRRFRF